MSIIVMAYNIKSNFSVWQLYVFGGKNEEQEFNDLKVMKLINPSERQPGIIHVYFINILILIY